MQHGIEVIATRLVMSNGKITGEIDGLNCNGEEKVMRINEVIDLKQFSDIVAYGDTRGDLPMLALATRQIFKPFRDKK